MKPSGSRMLRFVTLVIFLLVSSARHPASAGTITGTVRAEPATGDADAAEGGSYGSRRFKFLERVDYDELTDFVIYVDHVTGTPVSPKNRTRAVIAQRDGTFSPHVLPVVVGSVVEWPNEDDIFHNVFSASEATPFDLGLYKNGDPAKRVVFDKPGRVDVFCSIHSQMNCIVLVLPNPWFARADANGRFAIKDVPAGTYQLKAWHERLPSRTLTVTVPASGEASVAFVLGFAPSS